MKISELIKSNYIRVDDLNGEAIVITIKKLTIEKIGNPPQEKSVLWFDETPLGLVLNKTNIKKAGELFGNETDEWVGKKVKLSPSETEFGGKSVPCIRLGAAPIKKKAADNTAAE